MNWSQIVGVVLPRMLAWQALGGSAIGAIYGFLYFPVTDLLLSIDDPLPEEHLSPVSGLFMAPFGFLIGLSIGAFWGLLTSLLSSLVLIVGLKLKPPSPHDTFRYNFTFATTLALVAGLIVLNGVGGFLYPWLINPAHLAYFLSWLFEYGVPALASFVVVLINTTKTIDFVRNPAAARRKAINWAKWF